MDVYNSGEEEMSFLREKTTSGVKWSALSTTFTTIIQILQIAILARLLSKSDFGLMGMIMVAIGFAQAFSDMGISNAIIYRQDSTKEQLSSLYWLNIFAGISVFFLILASTPLIVGFYNEPQLADLIFWTALVFPITSFGQQFQILLQKELMFNRLAKIEIASAVVGGVIAVLTAFKGYGVFSLIWGQISNITTRSLLLICSCWYNWHPLLSFKLKDLKGYLNFGLFQMGERSVNYLSANVDYLVIGRFLGVEVLGLYTLAYQLVIMPLTRINPIITRVAFPVFSKIQIDDSALRKGYLEMIKLIAFIIFPLLICLAVTAPVVVPALYGPKWEAAIYLVQILSVLGIVKALGNPNGSIYLAKGRADIGFYWNVFAAVINTLVFWYAVNYGVYAVAWAYVVLSIIYFLFGPLFLKFIIGLNFKEYFSALSMPAYISAAMGIAVTIIYFLTKASLDLLPSLIILTFSGMVIYSLMMIFFEREYVFKMLNLFLKRKEA